MRPSWARLALAALLLATAASVTRAKDKPADAALGTPDVLKAYEAIEGAVAQGGTDAAERLFEEALHARYAHVAVAAGDALRSLGRTWRESEAFEAALAKALDSRDPTLRANLARVLGAWADPTFDTPLARLATEKRHPEVQAEALFMAGALGENDDGAYPKTAEAILAALKSRDPEVLIAACAAAGRRGSSAAVTQLTALALRSTDLWVGTYAVRALERIDAPVELEQFVKAARRKQKSSQRIAVLKAIGTLARPGDLPLLTDLLRNRAGDVRDAALAGIHLVVAPARFGRSLAGAGPLAGVDADVVARLAEALVQVAFDDEEAPRRAFAAHVLRAMGAAAAESVSGVVEAHLSSKTAAEAYTAMELGPAMGVAAAFDEAFERALNDEIPFRRVQAAGVLGAFSPQEAGRALLAVLGEDRKGDLRRARAAEALGYVRDESVLSALIALVGGEEREETVASAIEASLERLTGHRFGWRHATWQEWLAKDTTHFVRVSDMRGAAARRRDALASRPHGYGPAVDESTERGLAWLAMQQHGTGYWASREDGWGGLREQQPGYTALALLAFLGAGYDEAKGRYRETVWRATEFLAAIQAPDGRPGGTDTFQATETGTSRIAAFGTYILPLGGWALAEAWGSAEVTHRRASAQRALDFLVYAQNEDGGWNRPSTQRTRTEPTILIQTALSVGAGLGLEVDHLAFDGADLWLRRCSTSMRGLTEELADRSPDPEHTVGAAQAARVLLAEMELPDDAREVWKDLRRVNLIEYGVLSRLFVGWERSHPFLVGGALYLLDHIPRGMDPPADSPVVWLHIYWCFGSWAMYQMGGRYWDEWSKRLTPALLGAQSLSPDASYGSWPQDSRRTTTGRLFSTSMAVLALQSWYRFPALLAR